MNIHLNKKNRFDLDNIGIEYIVEARKNNEHYYLATFEGIGNSGYYILDMERNIVLVYCSSFDNVKKHILNEFIIERIINPKNVFLELEE